MFQSGGGRSIREIIEQYVVYPEVSIHYEAEESECVCDYLSEEKFLEELHRAVPKPEDGIYKPVRQIIVPEEIFRKIQDCYPEILWEERPRVDIYCLPLDYFSHSPLIKGVTMIAKASGKAVWRAEGLDEKYVPAVNLSLTPVYSREFPFMDKLPQLIIQPEMPNENREELKRRILPQIRSCLLESGINLNLSPFTFSEVFRSISLEKEHGIQGVTFEEFRAFQQTVLGRSFFVQKDYLEDTDCYKSWFEQYFRSQCTESDGSISVSAHNGIFADGSQLLVLGNSVVSCTICILKDRFCPELDLARNRIRNLPLEAVCHLDAITDHIMYSTGIQDACFNESEPVYRYRDEGTRASLEEYAGIFERAPELLSQLHFFTEFGVRTIKSLKDELDRHEKVYVYTKQARPIHMAALLCCFSLTVSSFGLDYERRIFVTKRADASELEKYLAFPPALFLSGTPDCDPFLSGYDRFGLRSGKPYNVAHPFSVWLIHNREVLQNRAPGIYTQIIVRLINGFDIVQRINESLNRLRKIPKLGTEVFRDLSHDDFFTVSSDLDYWFV